MASRPSISGICTSIRTRSKVCDSSAATASRPLLATTTGMPLPLQQADGQLLIDQAVFGQQDPQRRVCEPAVGGSVVPGLVLRGGARPGPARSRRTAPTA